MSYELINTLFSFIENGGEGSNESSDDRIDTAGNAVGERYLYLWIIDLLVFCFLTYKTYNSSKRWEEESENPENFRPKFIKWLVISNTVRSMSLLFIILFKNPQGNTGISWWNTVLHIAPAFLFVSSYMYLATFLADLYYKNIEHNNHLLKPFLGLAVGGGYLILFIIAFFTLAFKAYLAFYYISEFLMAALYLILGTMTIYYGRKVTAIVERKTQNKFDATNETMSKWNTLSISLGSLFWLKGISGLLSGLNVITPNEYPNVYDFFWFLILEVAPTVIFIIVARQNENVNLDENARQSSFYEMDYSYRESSRGDMTSYRPPEMIK